MRVFLDTVGCRLNQSEIERLALQFQACGHQLVDGMDSADIVVVNTCAVTAAAAQDSRQKLRQALRKNPQVELIATGCLASLDEQLEAIIPGIAHVVPNKDKDTLVNDLFPESSQFSEEAIIPTIGGRRRTRLFLKVQDGCNHFCTFCITRIARGKSHSVPVETILNEIDLALVGGVKEIVLTGVQLGSWGSDHDPRQNLADLIRMILNRVPPDLRLRISSIEPWDVTPELISLWQDERLCPHFHIPLQSGSERILRQMARKNSAEEYNKMVGMIRELLPKASITTDLIVGFPGETDADFDESMQFVRKLRLAGGHPFHYSARQGTPAARLPEQIHGSIRLERAHRLREVLDASSIEYRDQFIHQTVEVLWETARREAGQWRLAGWSREYIRVETICDQRRWNEIDRVRVDEVTETGWLGTILNE